MIRIPEEYPIRPGPGRVRVGFELGTCWVQEKARGIQLENAVPPPGLARVHDQVVSTL